MISPCRIYFADLTHTGVTINADTFPLGIGLVAACTISELKEAEDVSIFKFPEDLNNALKRQAAHILCMSNYS